LSIAKCESLIIRKIFCTLLSRLITTKALHVQIQKDIRRIPINKMSAIFKEKEGEIKRNMILDLNLVGSTELAVQSYRTADDILAIKTKQKLKIELHFTNIFKTCNRCTVHSY